MKVYYDLENFQALPYAVVTSGTFDGVHKGHQKILQRLQEVTNENKGESVVITYWPHPRQVLHPQNKSIKILSTKEEKVKLLERQGIDHLLIIPFTKEFSQISSDAFIKNILVNRIGTKKLVIGYDHRFGKNREGGFEYLKEHSKNFGFEVEEIPRQDIDDVAISSSNIRKALSEGNISVANECLGLPYSLSGLVVKGKQLGRTIGFPTANIQVSDDGKLIPKDGIYAVMVMLEGKQYKGMMSIGFNPTVHGTNRTIEVNIFDFDREIYGQQIEVFFIEYLRDEMMLSGLDTLKAQIANDQLISEKILSTYKLDI